MGIRTYLTNTKDYRDVCLGKYWAYTNIASLEKSNTARFLAKRIAEHDGSSFDEALCMLNYCDCVSFEEITTLTYDQAVQFGLMYISERFKDRHILRSYYEELSQTGIKRMERLWKSRFLKEMKQFKQSDKFYICV